MNTRPPTQPAAALTDTLTRAVGQAEAWRDRHTAEHARAEHLHQALNRVLGLTRLAAAGRVDTTVALTEIGQITRDALTRSAR